MPKLPTAGAELQLDTSKFDAGFKGAIADAAKLDAAISDLGGTVDLKVNVNDSELNTAVDLAANLDGSASFAVNVDESEIDSASDKLDAIIGIGVIDLAFNIAGAAGGVLETLGRFSGIGGVVEMDNALSLIEARTGRMIPQAEELITDLYINGWGESRDEIAGVVAQAGQLQIAQDELGSATETAFQVATATGEDVHEVLRTMDTMVKSNLVPDYQTAGDVMVTGFQNGLNKADDLLDTLGEYGTTFSGLRVSGEGALAILESGMANGAVNTDFVADAIRELGIRLGEIGTNADVQTAFDRLDELSDIDLATNLDLYEEGKMSGDDFLQGIFDAIDEVGTTDPQAAQTITNGLVGTQAEDLKFGVFAGLKTQWDNTRDAIEGSSDEAGTVISDNLTSTIESGLRQIEQAAVNFLSSDAIDLDGKIDDIKTGIQNGLAALQGGATVDEALEVTLGVDGLTEFIDNFERLIGNFSISILEAVALIQDPLGNNENDTATRRQIAVQGAAQFAFDAQIANPDEFESLITQAAARGVSAEEIMTTLNDTVSTAMTEGDFELALGAGQGLVDSLAAQGQDTTAAQAYVDNLIATIKTEYETAIADLDLTRADAAAGALGMEGAGQDVINGLFGFDPDALQTDMDAMETGLVNNMMGIQTATDEAGGKFTGTGADIETAMTNAAATSALATDGMIASLAEMSEQAALTDSSVTSSLVGNTITTSFEEVGVGASLMAVMVGKAMRKIREDAMLADAVLTGIAAKVTAVNQAVAGAQTAANGGGFGGGGVVNNTNINVNNTNNVQSTAQAAANGYALGESIRGMS